MKTCINILICSSVFRCIFSLGIILIAAKDQIAKSFSLCCLVTLEEAPSVLCFDHMRKAAVPVTGLLPHLGFTKAIKKFNK